MKPSPFAKAEQYRHAEESIRNGAVTDSYALDRERVLAMLNAALATELICVLRYRHHYQVAKEGVGMPIAHEFLEHSNAELEHADKLAERITQLGGKADLNPATLLERSHTMYARQAGDDLEILIKDDLIAERVSIDTYTETARYLGEKDPTTRRLIEHILQDEEEHADEMLSILKWLNAMKTGVTN